MKDEMNAHKRMAGADQSGNFGVKPAPGRVAMHPDMGMAGKTLSDTERCPPHGDKMGQPDHGVGKGAKDHFERGGKA